MDISFPRYISWRIHLQNNDPFSAFGKQTTSRIKKADQLLSQYGYRFIIEDVTSDYLDTFIPLYEKNILSKERGTVFPVRARIAEGEKSGKRYQVVSLYKHDEYLGGIIFSITPSNDFLASAYKVFPHEIPEKIPISVSFVADSYFYSHSISLGCSDLSHGYDRNIYGYHSSIGLACYKIQVGGKPFIPRYKITPKEPNEIMYTLPEFSHDMFLLLSDDFEIFSQKAILVSEKPEEELQKKFPILFSNKYFETKIISHSEIPAKPDWK